MESRKPSFGTDGDIDKKDLDLYSPKYREIIIEFKKMKQESLAVKTEEENQKEGIHKTNQILITEDIQ